MSVKVTPVTRSSERRKFFALRRELYQNDPNAVFPLASVEQQFLDTNRHPFYQHAVCQPFIAEAAGKVVGRIVAIVDQLQQKHDQNRLGFFGFFESRNDPLVARALISKAEDWLRHKNCDAVRGPVSPSMKGEFGVLVDGHDTPPSVMTSHCHGYYKELLESCGFRTKREFFAFRFLSHTAETDAVKTRWDKLFKSRDRILKRFPQINFVKVDANNFESVMREVNSLSNRVRAAGWGFVPLTPEELDFMIRSLSRVIRYDMIHIINWEDQMVGYVVNLPDINWAFRNTWGRWDWIRMIQLPFLIRKIPRTRVIALGVDEEFRTKGIAMLLIAELVKTYSVYDEWEFSWVDSENLKSIRVIDRTLPLVQSKKYELFEKPL